ncbi:rho GTPase-activating protein 18 isoform X1 [Octopus bimaculoides]|uniref:Rho-GAP domain-containing protein n=1 Tax=Octopus bimaculoides TaxID=37653 RepID=A0A0L8I4H2_OCTBM|nr:rho GTPase-activating protein 18 isoform X1 [Octopus bimaculoides]XP_014791021.1 rho GTPase-activating protein 18 isoform X1 [Octopus bimaculoides]XP_052823564.1 rho GTPase-activating protein 18 isoform X1 [Octopus bimaculoides]XP_052823565.1 rho GTPase-activating protein 18 isoform X1 [Octopus bimaculoides]XP_052823567.1 rho GTPase-activating protein 18 isoform X1 [Octopus bimaculoides]|eukprot:XP_014791020.1 PREDICTED: rho GTPase-activating protein 18-like isoform X1 [Octopus bimaculoides]
MEGSVLPNSLLLKSHEAGGDVVDMDTYWKEFQDIRQSKESIGTEDSEDDLSKTPDEGEIEAEQLTKIGLGPMISHFTAATSSETVDLKHDEEAELVLSSLTIQQRDTVQRWVDTLSRKKAAKTHVKYIFPNSMPPGQSPPSSPTDQPGGLHGFATGNRNNNSVLDSSKQRPDNRHRYFHRKYVYSMDGNPDDFEIANGAATGIEMLSINPKQTWNKWAGNHVIGKVNSLAFIPEHDNIWFMEDKSSTQALDPDSEVKLTNFILENRDEGHTTLSDLSSGDLSRLQCLAVIELSMLFEHYGIQDCQRKGKKTTRAGNKQTHHKKPITQSGEKRTIDLIAVHPATMLSPCPEIPDHGVFGVALQTQLENDQKRYPHLTVPLFFQQLIDFLTIYGVHVEGILRIPGATSRIKILRNDLEEQFYQGRFDWRNMLPNDASALLKQFLRDLPDPLLTNKYRESFVNVQFIPNLRDQLKALNLLLMVLPDAHRNSLMILLRFLKKVIYYQNENKMTLSNVAMIMAPNLFLSSSSKKLKNFKDWEISIAVPAYIIKLMVNYIDILWTIPPSMIQQLRRRYELEITRKSWKLKIPGKKEPVKKTHLFESPDQLDMIDIQVPHLSKSTRIQLFDALTVEDILFHVQKMEHHFNENKSDSYQKWQNQPHHSHHHHYHHQQQQLPQLYLYEVGGNIGERCLKSNALVTAIHRINPGAEWVIKKR